MSKDQAKLIADSSFGAEGAKQLSERTSEDTVKAIVAMVEKGMADKAKSPNQG